MNNYQHNAVLHIGDQKFLGKGIGAPNIVPGELCFNTAMTGYQEIITDPSYYGQIITFTFPHIGITGTNHEDNESNKYHANGIIIREEPTYKTNQRSLNHFNQWLISKNITGIYGLDTRFLTKFIKNNSATIAVIEYPVEKNNINSQAIETAKNYKIKGVDLASKVSIKKSEEILAKSGKHKILIIDCGIKNNIINCLVDLGCDYQLLPITTDYNMIKSCDADGILLSNGPGDPSASYKIVKNYLPKLINDNIPIMGICMGHQLLSLAFELDIIKMPQGHHGANHPIKNLQTGRVEITSQNHEYNISSSEIPGDIIITHKSLFDNSVAGIEHKTKPIFSVQYHPESSPGPDDSKYLFKKFIKLIADSKN
jgi:carbamoyl-phosphate synthase small subunit